MKIYQVMNDLNDKAFNTLTILRNATWLNDEIEIQTACQDVADYLKEYLKEKEGKNE